MINKANIIDAYLFLRENNHSIPSEVLEFIKEASLEKLNTVKVEKTKWCDKCVKPTSHCDC